MDGKRGIILWEVKKRLLQKARHGMPLLPNGCRQCKSELRETEISSASRTRRIGGSTLRTLEETVSEPEVDDVHDRGMGGSSLEDEADNAEHSEARVPQFRFLVEAGGKFGDEAGGLLVSLATVEQELILEGERGNGGGNGDEQDMDVGHEDDCATLADGAVVAEVDEGTPLADIDEDAGVREEAVALAVARDDEREEAEHGVTTVPTLGLGRGAPAAVGKLRELFLVFGHGLGEGWDDVAHGDAGGRGARDLVDLGAEGGGLEHGARERRADGEGCGDEGHCVMCGRGADGR